MSKKENRSQKFHRIAARRVNKIAYLIRQLGNLNSSNYSNTDEEVDKMFSYLESTLKETKIEFSKNPNPFPEFYFNGDKK